MFVPTRQVVAAVIQRDGRILIGQRKPDKSHPLKWEFPGGKVEPNESPEQAVVRELQEELGIEAQCGPLLDAYEVRYGLNQPTWLMFYEVKAFEREPRNLDFAQILWESPERLADYDFLEGDRQFLQRWQR
jgi:8-oxo-dGTP diphosphatase